MNYEIKVNIPPELQEVMTEADKESARLCLMRHYPTTRAAVAAVKRAYPRFWKFLEIDILPLYQNRGGAHKPAGVAKFVYETGKN